jgi:hypothetical protein
MKNQQQWKPRDNKDCKISITSGREPALGIEQSLDIEQSLEDAEQGMALPD